MKNKRKNLFFSTCICAISITLLLIACVPNVNRLQEKENVEVLITALSYRKDAIVRLEAANALGALKANEAVDSLIATLSDAESDVRIAAIEALAQIGDPAAITPVMGMIQDETTVVQLAAITALTDFGEASVQPLIDKLPIAEENIRLTYRNILVQIGSPSVVPLCTTLESSSEEVATIAHRALVLIGSDSIQPLVDTLSHEDKTVRAHASTALEEIGNDAIPNIVRALADINKRPQATDLLIKFGSDAVNPLIDVLKDKTLADPAVQTLVLIGFPDAKPVISAAEKDPDVAMTALPVLIQAMGEKQVDIWKDATDVVVSMGEDVVQPLVDAMKGNPINAIKVSGALVKIGEPAIPYLIAGLDDVAIRKNCADLLVRIGIPSVNPLINASEDDDADVRMVSVAALGKIGDDRAYDTFISALSDSNTFVQYEAVVALGKIKAGDAVDALAEFLEGHPKTTTDAAITSLTQIGPPAVGLLRTKFMDKATTNKTPYENALKSIYASQENAIIKAAAAVCDGEAVLGGAVFNRYVSGTHPLFIVTSLGNKSSYNSELPLMWLPFFPEELEAVVCLKSEETTILQTCKYHYTSSWKAAPDIIRYRYKQEGALYAAATGKQLTTFMYYGTSPASCPWTTFSARDIYGNRTTYTNLETWLKGYGLKVNSN